MHNEIMLETKNLKKYFSTKSGMLHAVDDVNISIHKGETLGVVGESGCGKSTLGRTVIRLLDPTSGQIIFDGKDISGLSNRQMRQIRSNMQIVFQDPYASLDGRKSVFESIGEPLRIQKTFAKKQDYINRIFELMETVGLADRFANSYPHELDGGRRQRVGIARAIATNPAFMVLDEPVSALDVSIQAQILNLLMELQRKNNFTYLFISHDLSVVKHISDRIAVMYLGKIVEMAEEEELFDNPLHPYTKSLLSAIPLPDPIYEKQRTRITYNPLAEHDYSVDQPSFREITTGHFVYCNDAEEKKYKEAVK